MSSDAAPDHYTIELEDGFDYGITDSVSQVRKCTVKPQPAGSWQGGFSATPLPVRTDLRILLGPANAGIFSRATDSFFLRKPVSQSFQASGSCPNRLSPAVPFLSPGARKNITTAPGQVRSTMLSPPYFGKSGIRKTRSNHPATL